MNIIILCLTCILFACTFVCLLETYFNFKTQRKARKNPQSVPHTSGGMAVNRKTGKLEEVRGQPILPFPNAFSAQRITLILILAILIVFLYNF